MNTSFSDLHASALKVQQLYRKLNQQKGQNSWTYREYTEALVGDVGDLMKLVMAKDGFRSAGEKAPIDEQIAHELADCLWAIMVIATELGVDLETEFPTQMDQLAQRVQDELE